MNVVGLSTARDGDAIRPLELEGRIRFNTGSFQMLGYFELFAEQFDEYAQRDSQAGIRSLNVSFRLKGEDLTSALAICADVEHKVNAQPISWRPHLGTYHRSGQPVRYIEPLLFKHRALLIVGRLRLLIERAISENKSLVYANGMLYRAYCRNATPSTVTNARDA